MRSRERAARGHRTTASAPRLRRPHPHPRHRPAPDHPRRCRAVEPGAKSGPSRATSSPTTTSCRRSGNGSRGSSARPAAACASLRLAERAALWGAQPEVKQLPSLARMAVDLVVHHEGLLDPAAAGDDAGREPPSLRLHRPRPRGRRPDGRDRAPPLEAEGGVLPHRTRRRLFQTLVSRGPTRCPASSARWTATAKTSTPCSGPRWSTEIRPQNRRLHARLALLPVDRAGQVRSPVRADAQGRHRAVPGHPRGPPPRSEGLVKPLMKELRSTSSTPDRARSAPPPPSPITTRGRIGAIGPGRGRAVDQPPQHLATEQWIGELKPARRQLIPAPERAVSRTARRGPDPDGRRDLPCSRPICRRCSSPCSGTSGRRSLPSSSRPSRPTNDLGASSQTRWTGPPSRGRPSRPRRFPGEPRDRAAAAGPNRSGLTASSNPAPTPGCVPCSSIGSPPWGATPRLLLDALGGEAEPSICAVLLMALVITRRRPCPRRRRTRHAHAIRTLFQDDPDPEVHSARDRSSPWGELDGAGLGETLATGRPEGPSRWYVNCLGQTMIVIAGPSEFRIGLAGEGAWRRNHEGQYLARKLPSPRPRRHRSDGRPEPDAGRGDPRSGTPSRSPRSPAWTAQEQGHWYEAARYCNWLSEGRLPRRGVVLRAERGRRVCRRDDDRPGRPAALGLSPADGDRVGVRLLRRGPSPAARTASPTSSPAAVRLVPAGQRGARQARRPPAANGFGLFESTATSPNGARTSRWTRPRSPRGRFPARPRRSPTCRSGASGAGPS